MANDIVETVLAGILEELGEINRKEEEQKAILQTLENKMEKLEEGLTLMQKQTAKQVSTMPVEAAIAKGINRLQQTIEGQPKTVRREFRVLLFPEYNPKEYYRLVFGRLIFWMIVVLITTYSYLLGKQIIEKWSIISSQNKEIDEHRSTSQPSYKTMSRMQKKRTN